MLPALRVRLEGCITLDWRSQPPIGIFETDTLLGVERKAWWTAARILAAGHI